MKVCHTAVLAEHRCGLFRTAREMVEAERRLGIDARLVDPLKPSEGEVHGTPMSGMDFARECDIIVAHHGISQELDDLGKPFVTVLHGEPRSTLAAEEAGGEKEPAYTSLHFMAVRPRCRAVVTLWRQHLPYWRAIMPPGKLVCVPAPILLDEWPLDCPGDWDFGGWRGEINVLCCDPIRMAKTPFHIAHGFTEFARKYPAARWHQYGVPNKKHGWLALWHAMMLRGNLGQVSSWCETGMARLYHSADIIVTGVRVASRVVREALACGRQVVMGPGEEYTPYTADPEDPPAFARAIERAWLDWCAAPEACKGMNRDSAETHFDSARTGRAMEQVLNAALEREAAVAERPTWEADSATS